MLKKIKNSLVLALILIVLIFGNRTFAADIYKEKGGDYNSDSSGLIQKYQAHDLSGNNLNKYDSSANNIKFFFGRDIVNNTGSMEISNNTLTAHTSGSGKNKKKFGGWGYSIFHDFYNSNFKEGSGSGSKSNGKNLGNYFTITSNRLSLDENRIINKKEFYSMGLFCIAEKQKSLVGNSRKVVARIQINEPSDDSKRKIYFTPFDSAITSKYTINSVKEFCEDTVDDAYKVAFMMANLNVTDPNIKYRYWKVGSKRYGGELGKTGMIYSMTQHVIWSKMFLQNFMTDITGKSWAGATREGELGYKKIFKNTDTTYKAIEWLINATNAYDSFSSGKVLEDKTKKASTSVGKYITENGNKKAISKEGTVLGPFKISYKSNNGAKYEYKELDQKKYIWGSLENIVVKIGNRPIEKSYTDNDTTTANWRIIDAPIDKKVTSYSNELKVGNQIEVPTSGKDFYLWISPGTLPYDSKKKVEIVFNYKKMVCDADLYVLADGANGQPWISVARSDMKYVDKSLSISYTKEEFKIPLDIKKVDQDDGKTPLQATFRIKYQDDTQKSKGTYSWLYLDEDKKLVYNNSSIDNAGYFRTNKNTGLLTFKNVKKGRYYIYETSVDNKDYDVYEQGSNTNFGQYFGYIDVTDTKKTCKDESGKAQLSYDSSEDEVIVKNKKIQSNCSLSIYKRDADDNNIRIDATFKIQYKNGTWLKKNNNSIEYVEDESMATEYKTNNGNLTISNIKKGNYVIYETSIITDGYDIKKQEGYDDSAGFIRCCTYNVAPTGEQSSIVEANTGEYVKTSGTNGLVIYNKKPCSLTIYKQDKDDNSNVEAEFKIQYISEEKEDSNDENNNDAEESNEEEKNEDDENTRNDEVDNAWIKPGANNTTEYVTQEEAGTYVSKNGYLKIEDLKKGKYYIYETKINTANYKLSDQNGYDSKNKWVKYGPIYVGYGTVTSGETDYIKYPAIDTVKILNISNKISISGYVWKDINGGKLNQYNNLYDSKTEKTVDGITVKLMQKGDPAIEIASTKTANGGHYLFSKKVPKGTLNEYYVSFEYSKDYMPVEFSSTDINKIEKNGSRAMGKNGIATTYTGEDSELEKIYGLSGNLYQNSANTDLFNSSSQTLENINLGLKPIPTPSKELSQDISYVKIIMKGYEYTYIYGGTGDVSMVAAPQVSYQNRNVKGYTRAFYPSDVIYSKEHPQDALKVYVGYRIDIKNDTTLNTDEYTEIKMHVKSVTDTFDSNRYKLSENEKNWTVSGSTATIKEEYLKDIRDNGIAPNDTKTKLIEFSVKHEAIMKILENPKGIAEDFPTNARATSEHEYQTKVTYIVNNSEVSEWKTHYSAPQTKEVTAPYLIFKLGEDRQISGTVFEDKAIKEGGANLVNKMKSTKGEALGDGIKQTGENSVQDVKVELLDKEKNHVTRVYLANGQGEEARTVVSKPGITQTDENGNYAIKGIVPGEYYLRFVYGNGKVTYKYFNQTGNEENKEENIASKIAEKNISAKDYKSTIITSDVIGKALGYNNKTDSYKGEWYKNIESAKQNSSTAIDDLETRKKINDSIGNDGVVIDDTVSTESDAQPKSAVEHADTAKIAITIEDTKETASNYNELGNSHDFNQFYFGIIKQPIQKVELKKLITNLKLTDAQGRGVFEGNPETDKMQGVMDLDQTKNGGSTYARAEIKEDYLYDSDIQLTYEIGITNTSDINYYNDDYYWYGIPDYNKEVTLKPTLVKAYLDNTLYYLSEKSDVEHKIVSKGYSDKKFGEETVKVKVFEITDWKQLYTSNKTDSERTPIDRPTEDKTTIVAHRKLTNTEDDMAVESYAEINEMKRMPDSDKYDNDSNKNEKVKIAPSEIHTNGIQKSKLIITPPTGLSSQYITTYSIVGIVALISILTGIIIIRKKTI